MGQVAAEKERVSKVSVSPSPELNELLVSRGTSEVSTGTRLLELLKRPQLSYEDLAPFDPERPALPDAVQEQVEIQIKYEGYIKKQFAEVEEMRKLEKQKLPSNLPFEQIDGLRLEAREKLSRVQPENVGQASRISGVNPADISALLIWLAAHKEERNNTND